MKAIHGLVQLLNELWGVGMWEDKLPLLAYE
jgi:hypothetical protein